MLPIQPQDVAGRTKHKRKPTLAEYEVAQHSGDGTVETDPSGRYSRYSKMLGRGACKKVYAAFDNEEGMEVAWNQVELAGTSLDDDFRAHLFSEIRVLQQLKHRNIMSFHDWWYCPKTETINFITEVFTSGTLRQYRKKAKVVNENIIKRWAWQILSGLVYLHGHDPPIVHRDLKCDNIFINGETGVVKIGDLGLATAQQGLSVVGTPEFMAPEIYEECYDEKVDIYSFGMVLLELVTREYPYSECHGVAQIFKKVMTGVMPQAINRVGSEELRALIELCISHDPQDRPEARKLLKHPFFRSLRSNDVLGTSDSHYNLLIGVSSSGQLSPYSSGYSSPQRRMIGHVAHQPSHFLRNAEASSTTAAADVCLQRVSFSCSEPPATDPTSNGILRGQQNNPEPLFANVKASVHFADDQAIDTSGDVADTAMLDLAVGGDVDGAARLSDWLDEAGAAPAPEHQVTRLKSHLLKDVGSFSSQLSDASKANILDASANEPLAHICQAAACNLSTSTTSPGETRRSSELPGPLRQGSKCCASDSPHLVDVLSNHTDIAVTQLQYTSSEPAASAADISSMVPQPRLSPGKQLARRLSVAAAMASISKPWQVSNNPEAEDSANRQPHLYNGAPDAGHCPTFEKIQPLLTSPYSPFSEAYTNEGNTALPTFDGLGDRAISHSSTSGEAVMSPGCQAQGARAASVRNMYPVSHGLAAAFTAAKSALECCHCQGRLSSMDVTSLAESAIGNAQQGRTSPAPSPPSSVIFDRDSLGQGHIGLPQTQTSPQSSSFLSGTKHVLQQQHRSPASYSGPSISKQPPKVYTAFSAPAVRQLSVRSHPLLDIHGEVHEEEVQQEERHQDGQEDHEEVEGNGGRPKPKHRRPKTVRLAELAVQLARESLFEEEEEGHVEDEDDASADGGLATLFYSGSNSSCSSDEIIIPMDMLESFGDFYHYGEMDPMENGEKAGGSGINLRRSHESYSEGDSNTRKCSEPHDLAHPSQASLLLRDEGRTPSFSDWPDRELGDTVSKEDGAYSRMRQLITDLHQRDGHETCPRITHKHLVHSLGRHSNLQPQVQKNNGEILPRYCRPIHGIIVRVKKCSLGPRQLKQTSKETSGSESSLNNSGKTHQRRCHRRSLSI